VRVNELVASFGAQAGVHTQAPDAIGPDSAVGPEEFSHERR
jgi:hypothetical protein